MSDAHAVARGSPLPLSAEQIFFHATKRIPGWTPHEGVSVTAMRSALKEDGQSLESGWPYLSALPPNLSLWQPPTGASPVFRRETTNPSHTIGEIIGLLDADSPVVIAMSISENFVIANKGIVMLTSPDADVGWHAVVAVGHGSNGTEQFILIRNSWGQGWGLDGYAWIAETYLGPRTAGITAMGAEVTS